MFKVVGRKLFVVAAITAFLLTTMSEVSLAENRHSPVGVGTTGPDVVMEWNLLMLEMIKVKNIPNHFGNRTLAMVHIAMFDAINNIELKYTPFLFRTMQSRERPLRGRNIPRLVSRRAAAASAAYTILSTLYPADQAAFEALYLQQLALLSDNPGVIPGLAYGKQIGEAVLEWRQDDGSGEAASVPYPDGTELGEWRRTPPGYMAPMLPGWGAVTPFAMTQGDQFRLIGPPPLNSYAYARDYNEVMTIGAMDSAIRTPEQTAIARFWVAGIPRMWNLVARALVQQNQYDLIESARLFALLNVASADANIVGWDMKYHYGYWRPVTAIEYGDADGNDGTIGEFGWLSLIPAPAFPEYVSGHSTACGSAATVLAKFTGSDSFTFTLACEANQDLPDRTFHSFWEAACEAGISRIYGGIHFNFSNVEGLEAGRSLGRYVFENFMIPLSKTQ